jgi:hypothetical protein
LGKGLEGRGYKPQPGERTFEGYVKDNVPLDKEVTLNTKSKGFNDNFRGANEEGQFKRDLVLIHMLIYLHMFINQPEM